MITRIILGLIAIVVGTLGLRYNFAMTNTFPRLEFFERNLGAGSSYGVYKIICLVLVIGGILYMTGFGPGILSWLLSPLVNLFPSGS
jgi:hypothetical protein